MRVALIVIAACSGCRLDFGVHETGDAATDAGAPFCTGKVATLCTDFQDGALGNWTFNEAHNGAYDVATMELVGANQAIAPGEYASGSITNVLGVTGARIVASFDMRVDNNGVGEPVAFQLQFIDPAEYHGLEYVYRAPPSLSYIEEFRQPRPSGMPTYVSVAASESFPLREWHRVELEFDLRGAPHAIVRHDGTVVLDAPLNWSVTGTTRVTAGLIYIGGPADPWTLREDNVLVDVD